MMDYFEILLYINTGVPLVYTDVNRTYVEKLDRKELEKLINAAKERRQMETLALLQSINRKNKMTELK